jgi:type IV secretion system protein VirB6
MGVVTWMVDTTDNFLDDAGQTTFGTVASQLGSVIAVGATLAVIGVFINMVFQYKSMDGRTAFWFALKLMLISIFSLNWIQFNAVASAIIDGLDQLAGGMVAGLGGGGAGAGYFASAFDDLIEEFGNYLNAAGDNMHWMAGAMIGAIGAFLLGVIGALCGLVLIFAKIMLAFMIGIAPIMIALSLFDVSKDYFHRWLSSTASYALYPLVIAGVFSTLVGMSRSLMSELGDPSGASNIGALVPFFMMMFLAGGMIIATPLIVRSISGNLMMVGPPSIPGPGGFAKGMLGTKGSRARARLGSQSNAELAGAGLRQAGGATASLVRKIAERSKRLE